MLLARFMATDTSSDTPVNTEIPSENITQNLSNRQDELVVSSNEQVALPLEGNNQAASLPLGSERGTDVNDNMSQETISSNEEVNLTKQGSRPADAGRFTNFMSRVRDMRKKIPDDWGQKRTSDKVNESWGQRRSNL